MVRMLQYLLCSITAIYLFRFVQISQGRWCPSFGILSLCCKWGDTKRRFSEEQVMEMQILMCMVECFEIQVGYKKKKIRTKNGKAVVFDKKQTKF